MTSKKTKGILTRPEPPQLGEVRSDLSSAPIDDVAFTFFKSKDVGSGPANANLPLQTNSASLEQEPSRDLIKSSLATELLSLDQTTQSSGMKPSDFDRCYNQTLRFIEMNQYLADARERLADQCAELQHLGLTVREQVESLRTQLS